MAKGFSLSAQLAGDDGTEKTFSETIAASQESVFEEIPVDLTTFVQDKAYLGNPPLSEKQYQLVRHMEQIFLPETYKFMEKEYGEYWKPVRQVNYLIAQWGKGAGKDHAVRIAVARISYLLLCLKSPQTYFGFAEQDDIHVLNIAMNAPQAHRAFFKPLGQLLNSTKWFKDKIRNDISDNTRSIRLTKHIELISGHSEAENFEGLNLICAILDEISGFESDEQMAKRGVVESLRSAEGIFSVVESSAQTRFPLTYKVVAISYPRYLNDPIQALTKTANQDIENEGIENSLYWVSGPFATWEVNPAYDKYDKIKVPGSPIPIPNVPAYVKAFAGKKAAESRGKFLCLPERSANSYFRNISALYDAFPKQGDGWVEPLTIEYCWGVDGEGSRGEESSELSTVAGWQTHYDFGPQLIPIDGAIYALHADLAITGDKAGIAMCHVKSWERREHEIDSNALQFQLEPDVQEDTRPVVKVDFVTYYESDMAAMNPEDLTQLKPREIRISWFRNLIRELKRRGFVIGLVTFDNFQSQDSIQILETWGIPSDKQSMDRNKMPYLTMRDMIGDGRIEGYYYKLLLDEIEGLTDFPNKIDHPPSGSKDCADAVCGAILGALTLGGDEGVDPVAVNQASGLTDYFEVEYQVEQGFDASFWPEFGEMDHDIFSWNI